MSRNGYYHSQLSRVDYLWPLDTWRIYLVSGRPRRMPNFLTLINPMDRTTWLLLTLSIPTMISSIFVVDKLYGRQRNTTRRNILHRSIISKRYEFAIKNHLCISSQAFSLQLLFFWRKN